MITEKAINWNNFGGESNHESNNYNYFLLVFLVSLLSISSGSWFVL